MDKLLNLLYTTSTNIIKECLWCFSNISAGPASHVDKFVESDAFERVMHLGQSRNNDIKKEAIFVLCNSVTNSDIIIL